MIADNYREYMHALTERAVREIGPRESCSEAEKRMARMMAEEFEPVCDGVALEPFRCHPTAFLGFFPIIVLLYLFSVIFYWLYPPVSVALMVATLVIFFFQFVRYKELLDRFYPEKQGENVVGVINPSGEVKKRVIVCGHIDTAYEFNIWLYFKNAAIPMMIVTLLAFVYMLGIGIAKTVAMVNIEADADIYIYLGIASVALYPLVGMFFFFHTYVPVPGAMDDMAGVAVAAGLGQYLKDAKGTGEFFPEHTEVVLVGMACEEAGLRGARQFVKKHRGEFRKTPTFGLFIDGVYDEHYLTVIHREICTGAKHDPWLVKQAQEAAAERKWRIKRASIPLGASDATEFSNAGIPATCLLCQDTSKLVPNYHTRHDTIEHVRPESLAVMLQLIIDMIQRIDKK